MSIIVVAFGERKKMRFLLRIEDFPDGFNSAVFLRKLFEKNQPLTIFGRIEDEV